MHTVLLRGNNLARGSETAMYESEAICLTSRGILMKGTRLYKHSPALYGRAAFREVQNKSMARKQSMPA